MSLLLTYIFTHIPTFYIKRDTIFHTDEVRVREERRRQLPKQEEVKCDRSMTSVDAMLI